MLDVLVGVKDTLIAPKVFSCMRLLSGRRRVNDSVLLKDSLHEIHGLLSSVVAVGDNSITVLAACFCVLTTLY